MRLADTSFLVAVFQTGDRFHATAWAEAEKPQPILVTSEVLAETLGVITKRKGIDFARMAKSWLESKPHFQFVFTDRRHFDRAGKVFARPPERLDYVDALLVAWKGLTGATLLSYDEDLVRAAKRESS